MRENDLSLTNEYAESVMVLMHKWRSSGRHFVDEDAERPPVHSESMTLHIQDLWGQVLSRAAERLGRLVWLKEFGEAKISQLNIALFIYEHIFRFQIPVNNLVGV